MVDPVSVLGGIGAVGGLIGGVIKLVSIISNLKERWEYAELNITSLFSTLWAVKAALEEISDWRSTSKDRSPKSEQLDTNLELCIQGTAVLVAYMENRLKDMHLEDLSKYDKAKFMNLDTLFRNLANDLGAQVRALQLLLTTYQCRTLSEQNERLQRKDTRRVFKAARESTNSLQYMEKDIEDAASILSEAPSRSFEFDTILMQHQNYSRTYPRLYAQMQQNFPTRRSSTISTEELTVINRNSRVFRDPLIAQTPNLPFLGVPFEGEVIPAEADESDEDSANSVKLTEVVQPEPRKKLPDLPELEELQESENPGGEDETESQKQAHHAELKKFSPPSETPMTVNEPGDHTLHSTTDEHNLTLESTPQAIIKDKPSPNSDAYALQKSITYSPKTTFPPVTQGAKTWPVVSKRRESFDSLYDDSDEELTQQPPKSLSQNLSVDKDVVTNSSTSTGQTVSEPGQDLAVSTEDEEQESINTATPSSRPTSSEIEKVENIQEQEVPEISDNAKAPLTTEAQPPQESNKILTVLAGADGLDTDEKDVSTLSGDEHRLDFMSGLLKFEFDHDIDLQITPQASSFSKQQIVNLLAAEPESDDGAESVEDIEASQQGEYDATSGIDTKAPPMEDDRTDDAQIVEGSLSNQSSSVLSNADLAEQTIVHTPPTADIEAESCDEVVPLSAEEEEGSDKRDSFENNYYTHRNDPFRNSTLKENIAEGILSAPNRPPPPIPRISKEPEDPIPTTQHSSDNLYPPPSDFPELASTETSHGDNPPSPNSNRLTGLHVPGSPASARSHRGTASVTSMESLNTSRNSTSGDTEGTMTTAATSNSTRIIPDIAQHEKMRSTISKSLNQLGQRTQPPVLNRLSTFASKLNRKATNERNARVQQLAHVMMAGNTPRVQFVVDTFDKATDLSIPVVINNEKEPITAFVRAARLGNTEYMEMILDRDPQGIVRIDANGRTVLHHAIAAKASLAVLWLANYLRDADLTLLYGKNNVKVIDIKDTHGISAVHLAARLNDIFIFETLQKAGAHCGIKDNDGRTVLEYAVEARNFQMVQYLLKQDLVKNINSQNIRGETALMIAAKVNDGSSLAVLLGAGANKDLRDNNGDLAIHYAAKYGNLEGLELLFQSIEDITAKNVIGEQPLHLAAANNHSGVLSALLRIPGVEANAWTEPPHIRQSVKRAEGLAATAKLASTALHYACSAGQHQAADVLLERGARVNSNQEDGFSALMMACQAQSSAIVSLLLLHGADPKGSTSAEGMTALHISCKLNDVACTRMLLEHGASPTARLTIKSKETPDGLAYRDNPQHQHAAADICIDFRRAMLRDRWGLNGAAMTSTTNTTLSTANTTHPPNVRPMISPLGFPNGPTATQSIGMPGTQRTTNYPASSGGPVPPLPPPPYQA